MKPSEIILVLVAAAFGGVAVVSWSSESEANDRADLARTEATEAIRANGAKVVLAERRTAEAEAKLKAAQAAEANAVAKITTTEESSKKVVEDLAVAKADLAKTNTKVAELEKARSESAARVNELTAEVAKLRDGSEIREAIAKQKKAEADLEGASTALREANAKLEVVAKKLAEVEEENRRLTAEGKSFDNASPNYRAR
jgi:chromosome segregation ATPase